MKQILQNLKNGQTYVEDVPAPGSSAGTVLIQTLNTLISIGTEKMAVDFGRSSIIGKIRKQPDKVRMVLNKVKTDGIIATYESVQAKLEQPLPLGYCNVGIVLKSSNQHSFKVGERVASNGAHAEIVGVSPNLCCKIPDNVSDQQAAFTVMGAIALQGVRLARPTLGETFVVMGLGLVGLLTVQLLRASGCKVIAIDFDEKKLEQAAQYQAKTINAAKVSDVVQAILHANNGEECDGILMTLSTDKDEPIHNAAQVCRKRGRIILVGVTGLKLSRADFYEKEISFQVSCSYGPGRYDPVYEEKGNDYPKPFVRWTSQRNMQAFLDMVSLGKIVVDDLISHVFSVDEAAQAYELVAKGQTTLGVLLKFSESETKVSKSQTISYAVDLSKASAIQVGVIGVGNYAQRILLPYFKQQATKMHTVCSFGGVSAAHAAKKFGFRFSTSSAEEVITSSEINSVVVATRHNTHASYVLKCLEAGKHVFVEKPFALRLDEVDAIESYYARMLASKKTVPLLTVGFNRRFSPFSQKMKSLLDREPAPKTLIMTINAGFIPADHWTQDLEIGGGRLVGEACHFIDLARFFIGRKIINFSVNALPNKQLSQSDCATISLTFEDGSQATIHYLANGHKSFAKERIEVFCAGKILQLDNFRALKGYGWPGFKKMWSFTPDKGQKNLVEAFCKAVLGKEDAPIPLDEVIEVAKTTIQIGQSLC
ncbi:bi-domain-containing oxidoreductase [Candidatus Paracaedibacter symbiosus]|uniref:bi-domain-containing oxidoreductase n=1 Tax=Candidatus Paracaedibacter symbiosus TaxID=244582 RepID=UPI000509E02D|nr:bi-domain-containing oxidoreductase [Candidatus Paracaedibacter symbiosus]